MAQARAAATRQKILDAAVDLIAERGYAETSINDITERAQVTNGGFYYHYSSKEALATTIIAEGWPKAWEVFARCTQSPTPGLENVIVMTFALSALMKQDTSVWVANHLNQSLGLLTEEGRRNFEKKAQSFISGVAASIRPSDIRSGVTAEEFGAQVWMNVHGCHLLSDAMDDSVSDRLVASWRILLRAIVPEDSGAYFEQFLLRTAGQYPTVHGG